VVSAIGMTTSAVGSTSVRVADLGFGAAPIGNLYRAIDDETAEATVETAWRAGVRYFDTAPHYGLGLSESRLGSVLTSKPRAEYVISTKVGRLLQPNPSRTGSDLAAGGFAVPDDLIRVRDYSRDGVRRSLEASLLRLGLDRIDIVFIHDPEDFMAPALLEAVPSLIQLRDEGTIGAVGVGMNYWQPLARFVRETDVDVIMIAGRWTLIDRSGEPLLALCLDRGVSVVAAAPFNSGLLAKPWPSDDAYFDYAPAPAALLQHARAYAQTCDSFGSSLPQVAIQFPLRHPAVVSVVTGMRTPQQVAQNVAWASAPVREALWDQLRLDDIS
jgi:D-threo-aldose 1-dehydrogenase